MAKMKGVVVVNTERCKGCNLCVVACPLKVLALTPKVNQKGYNYVQQVVEDTATVVHHALSYVLTVALLFTGPNVNNPRI